MKSYYIDYTITSEDGETENETTILHDVLKVRFIYYLEDMVREQYPNEKFTITINDWHLTTNDAML